MLTFLKNGQASIPAAAQMETQDQQTISDADDYLTVAGHEKRLKQSTVLLAVLFVIGAVCVLLMIKKTTPAVAAAAGADESGQIASALDQLNGMKLEVTSQMQTVSGRFNQFAQVGQIALEDLKKNPFKRESAMVEEVDRPAEQSLATQQWLRDQARIRAAGLQLWSVTALPEGACCMINDKVLYKGGQIDGFTVTEIHDSSVRLENNGVVVELKMN